MAHDLRIGNQRDAIAKTCRSKRAYSFLICTRTLSNSALAARAARSASRAATSAKVHCQATSGSLPSPPACLTNISPAGSPIETRTAEALRRTSRTSAAQPGLVKEVEAEYERGQWICEVKLVDEAGKRHTLHVDVATNQVVKTK